MAASELDAVSSRKATDDTAVERVVTSVESALDRVVSFAVSEAAMSVKLDATDDTAVERVDISVESVFETEVNLRIPLVVNEMLELVWSSVTISPSVSSADGAVPIRVLIATLIALLRLPISVFSAFCREASTAASESAELVNRVATDVTVEPRAVISVESAFEIPT